MKIGFVGLGIMGKPMSKNLIKSGYNLIVFDLSAPAVDEVVEAGAVRGKSLVDVARQSDIIITMLPDSPDVKKVVLGEGGLIEGLRGGTILVDMSSINPLVSQETAEKLAEKNVEMLDAPVSGGQPKAVDGTLAIMAGGKEAVFQQVKKILFTMGASVTLTGDIGSGNVTKLANQIIVAANIAGMSEALTLSAKAGVDPEKVFQAIRGGLAGSTVLEAKVPLILEGSFQPGFRIELHIKDLKNSLETAREVESPTPITEKTMDIFKKIAQEGKGKDDHGGMIQYFEDLAKIKVRKNKDRSL